MKTRIAASPASLSRSGILVLAPVLALQATAALADGPRSPPAHAAPVHDFDTAAAVSRAVPPMPMGGPGLASAVMPGDGELNNDEVNAAPAQELAEGLGIQVDRNRRKFRSKAIDWVSEHSQTVGYVADFLVGGADSGWHLTVDPRGEDQYTLQWKAKFR